MDKKMKLLDGRELECYSSAEPEAKTVCNSMALDTTGKYLRTGQSEATLAKLWAEEQGEQFKAAKELFCEHVHLFLDNAEKILSDSRLFLAPVPEFNSLAFTGKSGLLMPTVGVYVEWWLHCKDASFDAQGLPIWYISGSPLSGNHACSVVDRQGKTHDAQLNGYFKPVWSTFMDINARYDEYKTRCRAYTLQEAVDILTAAHQ